MLPINIYNTTLKEVFSNFAEEKLVKMQCSQARKAHFLKFLFSLTVVNKVIIQGINTKIKILLIE